MRRRMGEGTDPGWPHEQVEIKAVNRQARLEEVAWRVEMCSSMRTQYQTADIGGIAPLQLGYRSDCDLWITRIDGQRWRQRSSNIIDTHVSTRLQLRTHCYATRKEPC